MGLLSFLRHDVPETPEMGLTKVERFDDTLNPNMRALRLTMSASELLLSMGVSANSVVSRALDITETYCKSPVHIDISYNMIFLSQLRGVDKEPLTLVRPIAPRDINYMMLRKVQVLIHDIHHGTLPIDEAEQRLDSIIENHQSYPWWLIMAGNGIVIAGVSLMFTSSWRAILTTFVVGMLVERLVYYLTKKAIAPFFRQIAAAMFVTLTAAALNALAHNGVSFFLDANPTLIVVGGIVLLVAGLAVVGAIQDAIEEYYVTANARIARVILQTTGLVIGILIGLYIARKFDIGIAITPTPLTVNTVPMQVIGGALAAAGYAMSTQTYSKAVAWVGLIGGLSMAILFSSVHQFGITTVAASGLTAIFVGIIGAFMSRFWRTPSVGIIASGIVPLVPGLMLYSGLMQLINYPPGDPLFYKALGTLFTAVSIGLAIASGATFGSMLARPVNQKLAHNRNVFPFITLLRNQSTPRSRHNLAMLALHPGQFFSKLADKNRDTE